MANVQHKNLVDPNIHEPKGISIAEAGAAYIADGLGSGTWEKVVTESQANDTPSAFYIATRTSGQPTVASNSLVPLTWGVQEQSWGDPLLVVDSGFLKTTKTGVYHVSLNYSSSTTSSDYPNRDFVLTKTRGSRTDLHPVFLPLRKSGSSDSASFCIRLGTNEGIGLWAVQSQVKLNFTLNLQITRLSDG